MEKVDQAYKLKLEIDTKTAEFKASISNLVEELEALQVEIKAQGAGAYEGASAKATVSIRKNVVLDAEKVIRAVDDPADLAGLVKVSVPAAKKFLSEDTFEEASTVTETPVLKLSAK